MIGTRKRLDILANRAVLASALVLALATQSLAAPAALHLNPQFQPSLLKSLNASGLVGPNTKPIPAFSWTYEYTRPLKKPKISRETYTPIELHGLAQQNVETLNDPDDKPPAVPPKPAYSVRGLERVHEADGQLSFSAPTLTLPPTPGKSFDMSIEFEKKTVTQQCTVGASYAASKIHAAIPGAVTPVTCNGKTQYLGMNVAVVSTVLYFDTLALFFNESQDIQSPFGPVLLKKKITDFALSK